MEKPDISDRFELLDKKMENMHGMGPDKTDRFDLSANMSDLSGRPLGLLDEKLESMSKPDISDRLDPSVNMSDLSGHPLGLLDEKLENNLSKRGDKSDRFKFELNMSPNEEGLLSVLSVPIQGHLDQNLKNMVLPFTDNTDRFNFAAYEERLTISEYDGLQSRTQAERIAYLDAFVSVLLTLPHDEGGENWLSHRIAMTKSWLLDQGLTEPE